YFFDLTKEVALIEEAIQKSLEQGFRTKDIESPGTTLVGTKEMGDHILKNLSGQ
ncbi:MAG: 3-isopropylmalate dehydrogenase, partial [Nitrospira sp.]|nr:3-isopropylmalate dehydrogenase [Nitrospira sp.]